MRSRQAVPATRETGFTLIEMLIMLIISSIVAALTIEAIRAATSNGIRVEQAAQQAVGSTLDAFALRNIVGASRTQYVGSAGEFSGDQTSFTAITTRPLTAAIGEFTPYTVSLDVQGEIISLTYSEPDRQFEFGRWRAEEARFRYFGVSRAENPTATIRQSARPGWYESWPQETMPLAYYTPLPMMIHLNVEQTDGPDIDIYLRIEANHPPYLRSEDILGGS